MKMDQSTSKGNIYLFIGGVFSLAFAVFQASAIFWSHELLTFFGGPVTLRAENPMMYYVSCIFVGAVVAICGLYALSGAGKFRRLPLLRTGLIAISVIYLLRGFEIYIDVKIIQQHPELHQERFLVFSIIALCVGLAHLLGVIRLFRYGRPNPVMNSLWFRISDFWFRSLKGCLLLGDGISDFAYPAKLHLAWRRRRCRTCAERSRGMSDPGVYNSIYFLGREISEPGV